MQTDAFQRGRGLSMANVLREVTLRAIDSDPGLRLETIDSMPQFKM
jgi:hypothetical protein